MSIHTNAIPETSQFREQSKLRPNDMTPPQKSQDAVELELSLPMLTLIIVAIGILIYGAFVFFGKNKGGSSAVKNPPATLAEGLADVTVSLNYLTMITDTKNAKYVFVEFSDFECPYCKSFAVGNGDGTPSTLSQIESRYITSGIMKHAYAPYIAVPQHKPAATNEALGLYCAEAQGKAEAYRQKVFEQTAANGLGIDGQGTSRNALIALAKGVGLNDAQFASCYDKRDIVTIDKAQESIDKEIKTPWSDKFGNQNFGTPAFAVCKLSADNPTTCVGKAYVGAWPYADMKGVIDSYLGADAPK